MSEYVFYAQTSEGYIIKFLADFLKATLKQNGEFCIDETRMLLRKPDENNHYLVEIDLPLKEFDGGYDFNLEDEDLFIGINLTQWQKLLKNVKKKDGMDLYIKKGDERRLGMIICTPVKKETCHANIFPVPKEIHEPIEGYNHPKTIPSTEFQKMIKKLSTLTDDKFTICVQGHSYASFYANGDNLVDSKSEFGDFKEDEDYYENEFYISDFKKIVKMPGMSKNMKIYAPNDQRLPIKIETRAGSLGVVCVYMKHAKYIEAEKLKEQEANTSVGRRKAKP